MSLSPITGLTMIGRYDLEVAPVLDVLIVGAGPGGTSAALRAKELGLSLLVVDYDDVLKRIRDYSKDKLILPDFGGGDQMHFPQAGELVARLYFTPIDKDEMHRSWKSFYRDLGVPVQVGIELTGLTRDAQGLWHAKTWDHNRRAERFFCARHVILSLGRGVPRRFDIPGNTDGIAFRLSDPQLYVGRPACVIGGGTSAAEAVIAISHAKAAAEDVTRVYWSYRGDRLPRVSKALAEVFFEAYLGNGNISYHPLSEPAAIIVGPDRQEYLDLRIDRRTIEGRPHESTHLEFLKENVIACIGEDIPEALLNNLGIFMEPWGPRQSKRMVVNRWLETVQPNVYMVGDILSQSYLETDDFTGDKANFREVQHRGNIKSALRDGVLVVNVIAQKLAGARQIHCELTDAVAATQTLSPLVPLPTARAAPPSPPSPSPPPPSPPPSSSRPGVASPGPRLRLVRLLPGEVMAEETELPVAGRLTIGRQGTDLAFPEDPGLADCHASVTVRADGVVLCDEGSRTGVFLRAPAGENLEVPLRGLVRAGRQVLVLAGSQAHPELRHFDQRGQELQRLPLGDKAIILGRDAPDGILDAHDAGLSRRHLSFLVREHKVFVKDLKSVNGTFLKIAERQLSPGDEILVGRQRFRLTAPAGAPPPHSSAAPPASPKASSPAPGPPLRPRSTPAGEPALITFADTGQAFPLASGQTVCDLAEAHGVAINAECHAGICGSDPVRIVAGGEHLEAPGERESETLEQLCGLTPGPCRLACMLRAKAPLTVEILPR